MSRIAILPLNDRNEGGLDGLIVACAEPAGPEELSMNLADLEAQLMRIVDAYQAARFDELGRAARDAAATASALRLDRMSRVARTICTLSGREDGAALAANLARLMRLGSEALATGRRAAGLA